MLRLLQIMLDVLKAWRTVESLAEKKAQGLKALISFRPSMGRAAHTAL